MQQKFSKRLLLGQLALLAAIGLGATLIARLPDRQPRPARTTSITFTAVALDPARFAGVTLAGAWRLTAADRRFGGLSALAIDRTGFVALSDSGVVVRFALPRRRHSALALIAELPGGPGSPRWKKNRDSEALARDEAGGWLVAFENSNELWRFDSGFSRPVARRRLGTARWPVNRGIESLVVRPDGSLLLLPEDGRSLVGLAGQRMTIAPIASDDRWPVSDAGLLDDGRLLLLRRRLTLGGLKSSLAELVPAAGGYRQGRSIRLGLGPLDNPEGIAAQPLPGGRVRLWLVTDDNFRRPMRTLLVALDLPARPIAPTR